MKAIERTILLVLRDAAPNMMRGARLYQQASFEHTAGITRGDFDAALVSLQAKEGGAQIFGVAGDDDTKWRITPEGLARLAS